MDRGECGVLAAMCNMCTVQVVEQCEWREYILVFHSSLRHHGQAAHTLYQLPPPISSSHVNYDLRPRRHNRSLPKHPTCLSDADFTYRLLYFNSY